MSKEFDSSLEKKKDKKRERLWLSCWCTNGLLSQQPKKTNTFRGGQRNNLRKDMNGFYKMVKKYLSFEIKSFEPIHYQNVELDEQVKKYLSFEIKS